ncbi:hypothetical protein BSKO_08770 [Bryopsis sp. KO-2023]|nr:hypothetical protein BSKO_08770 [Bryopsis sp. KO-2023]
MLHDWRRPCVGMIRSGGGAKRALQPRPNANCMAFPYEFLSSGGDSSKCNQGKGQGTPSRTSSFWEGRETGSKYATGRLFRVNGMRRASAHEVLVGRSTVGVLVLFSCFLSVNGRAILQVGKEVEKGEEKGGGGGVFLSEALPLRVEASSPPGLFEKKNTVLSISGRQAFTVVFSRSVVSFTNIRSPQDPFTFDPPVPGRFTWPRKYIVKWEPDSDWPLDNVIKLKWNQKFKSHNGIFLVSAGQKVGTVTLETPSLGMSLAKVTSDESNKLTGNSWDPRLGLSEDFLPEVPPDGKIVLEFTHLVSLRMLRNQSQIMEEGKKVRIGIKMEPCNTSKSQLEEVTCVAVSFTSPLKVATRYSLVLEVGTTYSKNAGSLNVRTEVFFGGLREFKIPFVELGANQAYNVDNRALAMWLPHGLSEATKLSDLKKEISVTALSTGRKLPFELEVVKRSILRLTTPLEPDQSYRIVVSSSSRVKDGFGLELKGSSILIETETVDPGFEPIQPGSRKLSIFEASQDWGREVSAMFQGNLTSGSDLFCSSTPNITIWSLNSGSDIANSLTLLQANSAPQSLRENLGSPDDVLVHKKSSGKKKENRTRFGGVDSLDVSSLIKKRGALATETCRSSIFDYHLTIESNVQVAVVSGKIDSFAWVTSLVTGEPLKGAKVTLYRLRVDGFQNELIEGDMFEVVSKGVSNGDGIALLRNSTDGLHASVEYDKMLSFVPSIVPSASFANKEIHDVIILDREVVKPGETLVIKGYAVIRNGGDLVPAQQSALTGTVLSISPPLNGTNGSNRFPVSVSGKHGGYQLEVPIPLDVPVTSYTVQFEAAELLGSFERFTINKPLSLDTQLTMVAPFWAHPTQNVTVKVSLRSRIRSLVMETDLQASWTISADPTATTKDAEIRGRANISTNEVGNAAFNIDLAALESPPSPGSILAVFLQWVGPSKEKHEARKIVRLEVADVSISLRETVSTHLPGQPFGLIALVTDLKRNPIPAEVELHLKKVSNNIATFARDSNKRLRGPAEQKCNLIAGDLKPKCRLTLPSMGRFIMEACIEQNRTTVCHRKPIGRPASAWRKKPLDFFAPVGLIALSDGPHEVPGAAKFAIENTYTDSYALLTWGSRLGSRQEVIALKNRKLMNISVELGDECLGDCGLSVVVAVPRQKSSIVSDVPVSKLFDPLSPHVQTLKRTISVVQNRSVEVDISFPSLKKSRNVAAPGQNLTVSVKLKDFPVSVNKSAEITVVAVEAPNTLDDENAQLENLASRFKLNLAVDFETTDTSKLLVPPKTLGILTETYLRRKRQDPWAPMLASDFGPSAESSTVGLSEQGYINAFQEPITKVPTISVEPIESFTYGSTAGESPKTDPPTTATEDPIEPELPWKDNRHSDEISVSPPLFETKIVESGSAEFSFIVPEKPGKYMVRAYVSAGSPIRFGNMERELRVQKSLMISPFCPPFARVGDVLEAGIELRALSKAARAQVRVEVAEESMRMVKVLKPSARNVALVDSQAKVSFRFKTLSAGNATIKFVGETKGGDVEEVETHLPILDSQDEINVFEVDAVNAKGSISLVNLHRFPKGKSSVNITMGIGDLPSFVSFSKDLINQNPGHNCPISAGFALSLCVARFVTNGFADANSAVKLSDQQSEEVFAGIRSNFTAAVGSLAAMTSLERGLETVKPCPDNGAPSLEKNALILSNARAIWIVNEVERLNETSKAKVNATGDFFKLAEPWRNALERQLVSEAGVIRTTTNSSIDPALVAISRAALVMRSGKADGKKTKAGGWKPPEDTDRKIVQDLSINRLQSIFEDLDVESQAYVLLADYEIDGEFLDEGIKHWIKIFRSGTKSGYIPIREGSQASASYAGNSLALIVLLRADVKGSEEVVEQLATFIRSPPLDSSGLNGVRDIDRAVAMLALRTYDLTRESRRPDVEVTLKNGKRLIANATLTTSSDPVFSTSIVDKLDLTATSLVASIKGKGMITIAISASYIPKTTPLEGPIYQGIFVEQSIQKVGRGESLSVVPESSILIVEVEIVVTEDLPETVVRVMIPGGLEPIEYVSVNGGTSDGCAEDLESLEVNCATQKIEPTLVTFKFKGLTKGTHAAYFHAVATTVGTFSIPPALAFVEERRDIMGLSRRGDLEICKKDKSGSCGFVKGNHKTALIACHGNCNGNGACDLSTGGCRCRNGFTGNDCGVFDGKK